MSGVRPARDQRRWPETTPTKPLVGRCSKGRGDEKVRSNSSRTSNETAGLSMAEDGYDRRRRFDPAFLVD